MKKQNIMKKSVLMTAFSVMMLFVGLEGNSQTIYQRKKVTTERMADGTERIVPTPTLKSTLKTTEESVELGGCDFNITWGGTITSSQKTAIKAGLTHAVEDFNISNGDNPVKIRIIDSDFLGDDVLGSTTIDWVLTGLIDPITGTWYPAFLLENLPNGENSNGTDFDIEIQFNSAKTWDLSTSGGSAGSNRNLMYIIMHEFVHGMGFASSANQDGPFYTLGDAGAPFIFDRYLRDIDGNVVWQNIDGNEALKAYYTSGNAFFELTTPSGYMVELYAPDSYVGSAIRHVDRMYEFSSNQLLTPFYNIEIIYTDIGWITKRMLETIGWELKAMFLPTADFSVSKQNPVVDEVIYFTDQSSGDVEDYYTDFGDGTSSREKNPNHQYTQAGMYTVTRRVNNFDGEDTKTIEIVVSEPILSTDKSSEDVPSEAGTIYIALTSNLDWSVSGVPDWITVEPMTGTGSAELKVTYTDNSEIVPRTGMFSISGQGESQSFTLNQAAATKSLEANPTSASVSSASGTINVTITANVSWTITDVAEWYSVEPMSGTGDATLKITHQENTVTSPRTDEFTISGDDLAEAFTLTQAEAGAILELSKSTLSFDNAESSEDVDITCNGDWTASVSGGDWLSVSPTSETGNGKIKISATQNTTSSPRTAKVIVKSGNITKETSVTQGGGVIGIITITELPSGVTLTLEVVEIATGKVVDSKTISNSNTSTDFSQYETSKYRLEVTSSKKVNFNVKKK